MDQAIEFKPIQRMTYQEFVSKHNNGEMELRIDSHKAGDFVLSEFADKHNKPAHHFWTWAGVIITIPLSIILIFIHWQYAIFSFILGALIISGARKSACQFVKKNMIEDENFWLYVLIHKGAVMEDKKGNRYSPDMVDKYLSDKLKKGE